MLANNLTDFIAYFKTISEQHKEIKSFVHGPSQRIVSQTRSDLEYPCLWLETPSTIITENGADNVQGNRVGAFVVLKNAQVDSTEQEDLIWAETESIALDIISKIKRDQKLHSFRLSFKNIPLEPISTLFIDNDYGWRIEFRLENNIELCYNPAKWNP